MNPLPFLPLAAALATPDDWIPLTHGGGELVDAAGDHTRDDASATDAIDIVGSSGDPAGWWFTDGVTVSLRMHLNESPWLSEEDGTIQPDAWAFALDHDSDPTDWEYVFVVTGPTPTIEVWSNAASQPGVTVDELEYVDSLTDLFDHEYLAIAESASTTSATPDAYLEVGLEIDEYATLAGDPFGGEMRWLLLTSIDRPDTSPDDDVAGTDDTSAVGALEDAVCDPVIVDADGDGLTSIEELALGTDDEDDDSDDDGLTDAEEHYNRDTNPLACDTDGDGLADGLEVGLTEPMGSGTDVGGGCFVADTDPDTWTRPLLADTDEGTLSDGAEDRDGDGAVDAWETDPNVQSDDADVDTDGIPDVLEARCGSADNGDHDGDGVGDNVEGLADTDGDGLPDFCDEDDDGDGVPTAEERDRGGDGFEDDSDGDGIPDYLETDSDGDGIDDGAEGTGDADCDGLIDPTDADSTDGDCADADGDGLTNAEEEACQTDPADPDSDADGTPDGDESCTADVDCDQLPDVLDATTDPDGCADGGTDSAIEPADTYCPGDLCGGHFTGGSCSTSGGRPAYWALAVALALCLRRRVWLGLVVAGSASAAELDAQRFHPVLDGRAFISLPDAASAGEGVAAGAWYSHAANPFVYRYDDGRPDVPLLASVDTMDITAAYAAKWFAAGVDLPVSVGTGKMLDGTEFAGGGLGDLRVQGAFLAVDRHRAGWGVAAELAGAFPTGNGEAWLGASSPTFGARVVGGVGRRTALTAFLGTELGGEARVSELHLGSGLTWGAGGTLPLFDRLHLVAELDGEAFLGSLGAPGAAPAEWRAGARYGVGRNLVASLAAGTGVTPGVGSPDYRVVAGLAWLPGVAGRGGPVADWDGDGVADASDLCPEQPEDRNGSFDDDGCPDAGVVPTRLEVQDPQGRRIAGATLAFLSGPEVGRVVLPDGVVTRSLPAGTYPVRVEAPGYEPDDSPLAVPDGARFARTWTLRPAGAGGHIVVTVRDGAGGPVPALVTILGGPGRKFTTGADGTGEEDVPFGEVALSVWAEGFQPEKVRVLAEPGKPGVATVVLSPSRVVVLADRVDIREKIFFEFNSSTIKAESFRILDDLTASFLNHPELRLVEIQGHTDAQGDEAYNLKLSQERAEAVRRYIVDSGVEGGRLAARGYGETLPLQPGESPEAHEANRRVVFKILDGTLYPEAPRVGPR
jgi:outer membrane protein OmpA-like peptidoglycan-associated protein